MNSYIELGNKNRMDEPTPKLTLTNDPPLYTLGKYIFDFYNQSDNEKASELQKQIQIFNSTSPSDQYSILILIKLLLALSPERLQLKCNFVKKMNSRTYFVNKRIEKRTPLFDFINEITELTSKEDIHNKCMQILDEYFIAIKENNIETASTLIHFLGITMTYCNTRAKCSIYEIPLIIESLKHKTKVLAPHMEETINKHLAIYLSEKNASTDKKDGTIASPCGATMFKPSKKRSASSQLAPPAKRRKTNETYEIETDETATDEIDEIDDDQIHLQQYLRPS